MKIYGFVIFLLLIGNASADQAAQPASPEQKCDENVLVTGFTGIPKDAASVADRLASCTHFWGEEPYDSHRKAEIDNALKESQCDTVEVDAAAIKLKYAKNQFVLNAVSCAAEL